MTKYIYVVLFFLCSSSVWAETSPSFLTSKEHNWIKDHSRIRVCIERDWAPFSYLTKEGKAVGLSKDYSDILLQKVGINVDYIPYDKWEDILRDIKLGKCDLLNGLYYTKERAEYISFTIPYLHMKEYFFTRDDAPNIDTMADVKDKTLALVRGYAVTQWVKDHYPMIKIIEKKTISDALYSVSTKESDVFIGDSPSARYNIEENFITGISMRNINKDRRPRELRMGARKEYYILANILSKSIQHLPESEKKRIKEKWIGEVQKKTNWVLIGSVFAGILLLTFISILFNVQLQRKVREKTEELQDLNHKLESKVEIRTKELLHLNEKLLLMANTDPMTGIYNRRYFFDVSQQILAISQKDNMPICIAMLDIDRFKNINDTYGHDVGDEVIKKVAEQIRASLREEDILIRFGGEEFLVVLLDISAEEGSLFCEDIRRDIENSYPIDKVTQVTISIGISELQPEDNNIDSIVKRADDALYQAKRTGRNRVVLG